MNANVRKTNNGVKLLAAIAVLTMVVCVFAAVMPAEQTDAATDDNTQVYGGTTLVATQTFESGVNIRVIDDLIVDGNGKLDIQGGNFTIDEGVTVTVQNGGTINVTGGLITINGSLIVTGANEDGSRASSFNVDDGTTTGKELFKDYGIVVNHILTITRGGAFTTDGTGNVLVNDGASFEVTKRSSSVSYIENVNINIAQGGTFTLNGYANNVEVRAYGTASYYTAGAVTLEYYSNGSAITSQAYPENNRTTANLTFTVTTGTASAFIGHEDNAKRVTIREYVLNVDGSLSGFTTTEGTHYYDKLTVDAGYVYNNDETVNKETSDGTVVYYAPGSDGKPNENAPLVPMTSVTGTLTINGNAQAEVSTNGYLDVTGTVTIGYNDDLENTSGTPDTNSQNLTIKGQVHVSGTITLDGRSIANSTPEGVLYIEGGKVDMTNFDDADGDMYVYGAYYLEDLADSTTTAHFRDLSVAVTEASAAGAEDVWVCSYTPSTGADSSYIINTDITIPDGLALNIDTCITIEDGVTVTFSSDADYVKGTQAFSTTIIVKGKLVDEGGIFDNYRTHIDYEVMKTSDDGEVTTYTTLKIALNESVSGETIELNGKVTISEDMTIPSGVTVVVDNNTDDVDEGLEIIKGAELTIDGILNMNGAGLTINKNADTGEADGFIVLNNVIVSSSESMIFGDANYTVAGAYFTADIEGIDETYFISSVTYAATNSQSITSEDVTLYGKLSIGQVEFTKGTGDDSPETLTLVIGEDAEVTADSITLNNVDLSLEQGYAAVNEPIVGYLSGTINFNVTAGTVTFELDKAQLLHIGIDYDDNGETVTTTVEMGSTRDNVVVSGNERNPVLGGIEIAAGTVTLTDNIRVQDLTIAEGAELVVAEEWNLYLTPYEDADSGIAFNTYPVDADAALEKIAPLTVNGTLTVQGGVHWSFMVVNGTVNIEEDGTLDASADIHGDVNIAEGADSSMEIVMLYGSISGESDIYLLLAYPGSDLSGALLADTDNDGDSDAYVTTFYLNGTEFLTAYTIIQNLPVSLFAFIANDSGVQASTAEYYSDDAMTSPIVGAIMPEGSLAYVTAVQNYLAGYNLVEPSSVDAEYNNELGTAYTSSYDAVYVSMDPALVNGTVSEGTGLNLFIDNVAFYPSQLQGTTGYNYTLSVGTHTVRFDVSNGYDATNATITFNGQTVENGGTIAVTVDMIKNGFTLTASGAVPSGNTVVIDGGNGDSGMGLTDYLLIILVILIVVMAIMVAMRLMRS